jgi:hypothetical protein
MATVQHAASAARTPRQTTPSGTDRGDRMLFWAAAFFATAVLIHNSDHARRGVDSVGRDVFWVGTSAILLEVGVVVLAVRRSRLAPAAAALAGLALATGYVVVHFLPARSWLSDSFVSATHVSPLSWIAASLEAGAALTLGVVGLLVLRQRGGPAFSTAPRAGELSLRSALLHPVVVALVLGNAVILAISFAQL